MKFIVTRADLVAEVIYFIVHREAIFQSNREKGMKKNRTNRFQT